MLVTGQLNRCNSISLDVVLETFPRECLREANQTHFGCAVVSLSEIPLGYVNTKHSRRRHQTLTEQASRTGCIDYPPELLLAEDWPGCVGTRECALEVDVLNLVPFFVGHIPEAGHRLFRSTSCEGERLPDPLSRRIPALLISMVTPPKASSAVLITAGPSVTDELFTTALPTPPSRFLTVNSRHLGSQDEADLR